MRKLLFLISFSFLMICFQNFGSLTEDDLRTAQILKELKEIKPQQSVWIAPQRGHTLESVGSDWLQRQGSLWLDGADQRWLESMNGKLQSYLGANIDDQKQVELSKEGSNPLIERSPSSVRFSRINSVEYKLDESASLRWALELDGAHFDYKQRLSKRSHFGIEHKSSKSQTSFLFKYDWE